MRKCFLTGLVILLPLAVTVWFVQFVVNFLTRPFMGIVTALLRKFPFNSLGIDSESIIRTTSQIIILISLFLIILVLGIVARKIFFNRVFHLGDKIIHKIPIVNTVYKTSKEIVKSLFSTNANSMKQVVLISFPYPGSYCIGLISHTAPQTCSDAEGAEMVSVFVPTAPNPSTGFLIMSRKSDLIYLDMKNEDAIKYVVSCAVITPPKKELSV